MTKPEWTQSENQQPPCVSHPVTDKSRVTDYSLFHDHQRCNVVLPPPHDAVSERKEEGSKANNKETDRDREEREERHTHTRASSNDYSNQAHGGF